MGLGFWLLVLFCFVCVYPSVGYKLRLGLLGLTLGSRIEHNQTSPGASVENQLRPIVTSLLGNVLHALSLEDRCSDISFLWGEKGGIDKRLSIGASIS